MLLPPIAATRQPWQIPELDVDNSLCEGLVGVFLPTAAVGNIVTRQRFASGFPRTTVVNRNGVEWLFNGTALVAADTPGIDSFNTLAVVAAPLANTGETLVSVGSSNGSDNYIQLLSNGNGGPQFVSRGTGIGGATGVNSWRFTRGAYSGSSYGPTLRKLFQNGVVIASNTDSAVTSGADRIVVGGLWRAGVITVADQNTTISLAIVARRAWTEAEHARWAQNPWQIFANKRRRFWNISLGTVGNAPGAAFTATLAFTGGAATGQIVGNGNAAALAQTLAFSGGAADAGAVGNAPGAAFANTLAFNGGAGTGFRVGNAGGASFAVGLAFSGGAASSSGTGNADGGSFSVALAFAGGSATGLLVGNAPGASFSVNLGFVGGTASVPGSGTYTLPPVAIYIGHNIAIGTDGRPIYIQF